MHHIKQLAECQCPVTITIIFGEHILERLRNKTSFGVVGIAIGAMLFISIH